MDKDLQAIQQARDLIGKAKEAQAILNCYSQEEIDRLVALMAEYGHRASRDLAEMACAETEMGNVESKIAKNTFATRDVYAYLKNLKTVGIIREDHQQQVYEIATPMGIVAAIIPCTNPTSTALYKILISIKARCTIVISPHPRAIRCIQESAAILSKAAEAIGAPEGVVGCMTTPTLEATNALMSHKDIGVILATGGSGLVKAAYSSGKPAIGVGPGNVPAFIEKTANIKHAVRCLIASQAFDWGTICCSEQSVVFDKPVEKECLNQFSQQGAHICNESETRALEELMPKNGLPNPELVGKSPQYIASKAGFAVEKDAKVLLVWQGGVGDNHPLSREKLAPILSMYSVNGWEAANELCHDILRYGGMGHSFVLHTENPKIITAMSLRQPVSRILVNAPSSQGGVGYATGLVPAMTLGCGVSGGNITSDNISANHLINIRRVAMGKPNWFPDLPTPQISLANSPPQPPIQRNPFDDIIQQKKGYYVGPHNNPNI